MNATPDKSQHKKDIDYASDNVNVTTLKDLEAKMWSELSRVKRAFVTEKKELRDLREKYDFSSQSVQMKNTTSWSIVDRRLNLAISSVNESVREVLRHLSENINHTLTQLDQTITDSLRNINWTMDANSTLFQLNKSDRSVDVWKENVSSAIYSLDHKIINFFNSSLTKQDERVRSILAEIKSSLRDIHNRTQAPDCNYHLNNITNTNNLEVKANKSTNKLPEMHSVTLVRLVNAASPSQGRVEVYKNGEWGTVCDDMFNNVDATVVCKMFGYKSGIPKPGAFFGQGTGPILMTNVKCIGTEKSLWDCSFHEILYCDHSEDVGVICS